jgi:three-Cys-motif partner protein
METQLKLFEDLPASAGTKELVFKPIRFPLWTENKAQLIAKYLYYFVMITKHGTYIDGFAAPQEPTPREGTWAAKLVLDTQPRLFHLREYWLCEQDPVRAKYLDQLTLPAPSGANKKRVEIRVGDFNTLVHEILAAGTIKEKTATFCLLDQRTFECHWKTVETIARHKEGNKIEQFYFLGSGWLDRAFAGLTVNMHQADDWWGGPGWADLKGMDGNRRARLVCDRFKNELGYTYAYPWPIYENGNTGRVMYHMIHATDHPEAPKIMARAYRKATSAPEPVEQLELELQSLASTDGELRLDLNI